MAHFIVADETTDIEALRARLKKYKLHQPVIHIAETMTNLTDPDAISETIEYIQHPDLSMILDPLTEPGQVYVSGKNHVCCQIAREHAITTHTWHMLNVIMTPHIQKKFLEYLKNLKTTAFQKRELCDKYSTSLSSIVKEYLTETPDKTPLPEWQKYNNALWTLTVDNLELEILKHQPQAYTLMVKGPDTYMPVFLYKQIWSEEPIEKIQLQALELTVDHLQTTRRPYAAHQRLLSEIYNAISDRLKNKDGNNHD